MSAKLTKFEIFDIVLYVLFKAGALNQSSVKVIMACPYSHTLTTDGRLWNLLWLRVLLI